ncbi:MAG: 2Fe-2S iron-sulfur cluster binding domain-containing protein [Pseudomonas sp.]
MAKGRRLNSKINCRGSSCGACKTRLNSGLVHDLIIPEEPLPDDEVQISVRCPGGQRISASPFFHFPKLTNNSRGYSLKGRILGSWYRR